MIVRIVAFAALLVLAGVASEGLVPEELGVEWIGDAAASTCDGWPKPIPSLLEECPHSPFP